MAAEGPVMFFTAEAVSRIYQALGVAVWVVKEAFTGPNEVTFTLSILRADHGRQQVLFRDVAVSAPHRFDPADREEVYAAFVGKIACLL